MDSRASPLRWPGGETVDGGVDVSSPMAFGGKGQKSKSGGGQNPPKTPKLFQIHFLYFSVHLYLFFITEP